MAEFPALPLWTDARALRDSLEADGWLSPNTYISRIYERIGSNPAIYLFLLHNSDDPSKAFVGYIGMATKVADRLKKHHVLPELRALPGFVPVIWFKPTGHRDLREAERRYILAYNPPWNVIGKQRGVRA